MYLWDNVSQNSVKIRLNLLKLFRKNCRSFFRTWCTFTISTDYAPDKWLKVTLQSTVNTMSNYVKTNHWTTPNFTIKCLQQKITKSISAHMQKRTSHNQTLCRRHIFVHKTICPSRRSYTPCLKKNCAK